MGFSSAKIPSFPSFDHTHPKRNMGKRKAETLAQSSPSALDPSSVARQPKVKPATYLSTPKRLTYQDTVQNQKPSAIACIAAARCGFDEGEMAAMMMARPVMAATHMFDLIQEPGYEHTEQNLGELLKHFNSAIVTLGGNAAAAFSDLASYAVAYYGVYRRVE